MKLLRRIVRCALPLLLLLGFVGTAPGVGETSAEDRRQAEKLQRDGNYGDAFEILEKLTLDPSTDPEKVGTDLQNGVACLQRLDRLDEMDAFREKVISTHPKNWRLLFEAARSCFNQPHVGFIVAGEFQRGGHRGGGRAVNAFERDRVRALQLMADAMTVGEGPLPAPFYNELSRILLGYRGWSESWRLQYLSDLTTLPDYDEGFQPPFDLTLRGAPATPDGTPIFYRVPESFDAAASDGERWRWALAKAMEVAPDDDTALIQFANFLHQQFGVQTMASYRPFGRSGAGNEGDESGPYAVETLGENETIARLATGIKRFTLPDEFNFIKIFERIAERRQLGEQALNTLAQIFENRRQYDRAAELWTRSIREYGPGNEKWKQKRWDQIMGNWGQFLPVTTQPAGKGATVELEFRNGKAAHFEAHEILVPKLLDDIRRHLESDPRRPENDRVQSIGNIGWLLVQKNERRYVGDRVAAWDLALEPRDKHFDKTITVETPLQKPGGYLLTATMEDGNVSKIVLWVADTVLVKKPLVEGSHYFVADAVTGEPVSDATLELFGYRTEWRESSKRYRTVTRHFARRSSASGEVIANTEKDDRRFRWLATATTESGRFAFLGFSNVWYGARYDQEYNEAKFYLITDRPVYRPGQPVHFKSWVRRAKYDQPDTSEFAGQQIHFEIRNPQGEKVFEQRFTADAYGGLDGEWELPEGAALGVYRVLVTGSHAGTFRVEEYKKPEFEVTVDAPSEPVMLGEKITATVKARYYFGAPVTKAKVKYKVLRSDYDARWYPIAPWDWLFGRGYWWFAYDYDWYPGWNRWGCLRPVCWWWPVQRTPPEVVVENEVPIGADGTVRIEIDTALAKQFHGDTDHSYEITAEVVDESRRTIVGTGKVLVAREPFKVYAWVDRGFYRVGDTIDASFSAQTLDAKPVAGDGRLELLKVTYDADRKPVETPVQSWKLDPDAQGHAGVQIQASEAGQYRLSYKVTDKAGHTLEGGYVFVVRGEGFDGKEFRFNQIELITDKKDYAPGEKVRLMINTDHTGGTVALFVRPANGIYLPPKIIRLDGKSTVEEIEVTKKDMPNFFVEAYTIREGKLHSETREVIVPPEQRVLNVEVTPSAETYKPGEPAKVKLRLTDFDGKPFEGSAVVSIYDKAVEYISGGSNVPDIKEFFWKWRRSHQPRDESNLDRGSGNLTLPKREPMQLLGVFGGDELSHVWSAGSGNFFGMAGVATRSRFASVTTAAAPMAGAVARDKADASYAMVEELQEMPAEAGAPPPDAAVEPTVRSNFADTAFWNAAIQTDANGSAEIELTMPENLTTWRVKTWAMGHGTKVGQGSADVVTTKNLILRMQAPRFFVEKDEVVLSANVHNYLETAKSVRVVLELDGETLEPLGEATQTVRIGPDGEQRVDWRVRAAHEGEAVIRMKALTDEESDAVEMRFPVRVHGMLKTESYSGAIRPEQDSASITVSVPAERRPEETRLEVRYSPTLAGALVDALPYLVEYPYGCTEQTLNRFLPTVITQKILKDMGLDLAAIREKQSNLNAQEIGDDKERAKQWKRWKRNPVFDEAEVNRMVEAGLRALTSMQLSDGGWGWFSGRGEESYPHTTAVVVHGLQVAAENGVGVVPGVLSRGVDWLKDYQAEQIRSIKSPKGKRHADNLDALVYMVLADAKIQNSQMREYLYRDRNDLSVYAKAMFGLALYKQGHKDQFAMLLRNIEQYLVQDEENQTAYLKLPNEGSWWCWYGSEYEAHAYYLKLLALTDPKGEKASRLVKYLLNNRKHATYWNSTRDTALCIEAMADFLKASREDKPDLTVEILVDGETKKEVKINAENLFSFDNQLVLSGDELATGDHKVELRKRGKGPLYFNAYLTNFTLEDFITKAGLEMKVNRKYYKLREVEKSIKVAGAGGQALDQRVEKYERVPIKSGDVLKSGDLVEVELEIESKNDYEYLVFEDMKPAGCEPVEVRSGYNGNDMGAYVEFRDDRVTFLVRALARGKHSVSYRTRAEIPGRFSALPTRAEAMYAPELKANSDELKLGIED